MKNLQVTFKCLTVSLVAGITLTACGTESLPSASVLLNGDSQLSAQEAGSVNAALKDVFGILNIEEEATALDATDAPQKPQSLRARFDNLKETHPELHAQVVEVIGLPSNERKERLGQMKKRPQMMKRHGRKSAEGLKMGKGGFDKGQGFSGFNPEDAQAKFDAWKTENPEIAAQLEGLKDLSPEERKVKIDELKASGVELPRPPHMKGKPGMKGQFGQKGFQFSPEDMKAKFDAWKTENPEIAAQLEGLKGLSPEERKAKFEELKASGIQLPPRPLLHKGEATQPLIEVAEVPAESGGY